MGDFDDTVSEVRKLLGGLQKNFQCTICLSLLSQPVLTKCNHQFCSNCVKDLFMKSNNKKQITCPLCKYKVTKRSMNSNQKLSDIVDAVRDICNAADEDCSILGKTPILSQKQKQSKQRCKTDTSKKKRLTFIGKQSHDSDTYTASLFDFVEDRNEIPAKPILRKTKQDSNLPVSITSQGNIVHQRKRKSAEAKDEEKNQSFLKKQRKEVESSSTKVKSSDCLFDGSETKIKPSKRDNGSEKSMFKCQKKMSRRREESKEKLQSCSLIDYVEPSVSSDGSLTPLLPNNCVQIEDSPNYISNIMEDEMQQTSLRNENVNEKENEATDRNDDQLKTSVVCITTNSDSKQNNLKTILQKDKTIEKLSGRRKTFNTDINLTNESAKVDNATSTINPVSEEPNTPEVVTTMTPKSNEQSSLTQNNNLLNFFQNIESPNKDRCLFGNLTFARVTIPEKEVKKRQILKIVKEKPCAHDSGNNEMEMAHQNNYMITKIFPQSEKEVINNQQDVESQKTVPSEIQYEAKLRHPRFSQNREKRNKKKQTEFEKTFSGSEELIPPTPEVSEKRNDTRETSHHFVKKMVSLTKIDTNETTMKQPFDEQPRTQPLCTETKSHKEYLSEDDVSKTVNADYAEVDIPVDVDTAMNKPNNFVECEAILTYCSNAGVLEDEICGSLVERLDADDIDVYTNEKIEETNSKPYVCNETFTNGNIQTCKHRSVENSKWLQSKTGDLNVIADEKELSDPPKNEEELGRTFRQVFLKELKEKDASKKERSFKQNNEVMIYDGGEGDFHDDEFVENENIDGDEENNEMLEDMLDTEDVSGNVNIDKGSKNVCKSNKTIVSDDSDDSMMKSPQELNSKGSMGFKEKELIKQKRRLKREKLVQHLQSFINNLEDESDSSDDEFLKKAAFTAKDVLQKKSNEMMDKPISLLPNKHTDRIHLQVEGEDDQDERSIGDANCLQDDSKYSKTKLGTTKLFSPSTPSRTKPLPVFQSTSIKQPLVCGLNVKKIMLESKASLTKKIEQKELTGGVMFEDLVHKKSPNHESIERNSFKTSKSMNDKERKLQNNNNKISQYQSPHTTLTVHSKQPPVHMNRVVVMTSRLPMKHIAYCKDVCEKLGGKATMSYTEDVSHLVMATDENHAIQKLSYTYKYLLALVSGLWIVRINWIIDSLEAGKFLDEIDYQAKGDPIAKQTDVPALYRKAFLEKKNDIFRGYRIYVAGKFQQCQIRKEQLITLLKKTGADTIPRFDEIHCSSSQAQTMLIADDLSSLPPPELGVIQKYSFYVIHPDWIIDSIINFKIQQVVEYILE